MDLNLVEVNKYKSVELRNLLVRDDIEFLEINKEGKLSLNVLRSVLTIYEYLHVTKDKLVYFADRAILFEKEDKILILTVDGNIQDIIDTEVDSINISVVEAFARYIIPYLNYLIVILLLSVICYRYSTIKESIIKLVNGG